MQTISIYGEIMSHIISMCPILGKEEYIKR